MNARAMDLNRTLVIGNPGSGKRWLANRIAAHISAACVDLDLIHWVPGGYNAARERADAIRLVRQAAGTDRWVIEGIYGWLVDEVKRDASVLIRRCIDEAECVANNRRHAFGAIPKRAC
ncbi:hypothetical protein [Burkholderia pyrrocinia]|uniref:hypothetical protein n=1 Tax=Burkholderia pyrrocinia TaxID=60550 RepID=UPI001BD02A2F|nr:hypothetical protein [Burkholderia pyrrocinia]QVN23562.1 hypothetical protein JYG32_34430 [Burkholderia pyrrocinia]